MYKLHIFTPQLETTRREAQIFASTAATYNKGGKSVHTCGTYWILPHERFSQKLRVSLK